MNEMLDPIRTYIPIDIWWKVINTATAMNQAIPIDILCSWKVETKKISAAEI